MFTGLAFHPSHRCSGFPASLSNHMRRCYEKKSRCQEPRRAELSSRRSDLPEVFSHRILNLRKTLRTVGMCEREVRRVHAVCLSISPMRDPPADIRARPRLVSNESADTTDGKQWWCDEYVVRGSGRPLRSCVSGRFFKRHTTPLSFARQPGKPLCSTR